MQHDAVSLTGIGSLRDYLELTKPRITTMIVVTTLVGFVMGGAGAPDLPLLVHTLIGTALVVASGNALNQLLERETDRRMRRTRGRPLPAGRMRTREALWFGVATAGLGTIYIALGVNFLTACLTVIAWANYLFVYTPLKRRTEHNTLVGAISGAMPPAIGWTAAQGAFSPGALALFAILFVWQLPHFYAIAWMYRDEYRRAGLVVWPVVDDDGRRTGRQIVVYGALLVAVSTAPTLAGIAGTTYLLGAVGLSVLFLAAGVGLARRKSVAAARHLLLASLLYLPALLALMIVDKTH